MCDTRTEWAVLRAFGIDVNPLMVKRRIGKAVDPRLIDPQPGAGPQRLADCRHELIRMLKYARGRGIVFRRSIRRRHSDGGVHQACWLLTDNTSPVIYDA